MIKCDACGKGVYCSREHQLLMWPMHSLVCNGSLNATPCAACSGPATMRCSACKLANYCSAEHQEDHWAVHSAECAQLMAVGPKNPGDAKASKAKRKKGAKSYPDRILSLWRVGGVLYGKKNVPWIIASVDAAGTPTFKAFLKKETKKEENCLAQLAVVLGLPEAAPRDMLVDMYYASFNFFVELHERQHIWRDDFRNSTPDKWKAQIQSDSRKTKDLVMRGWYGAIVSAFDGPFYDVTPPYHTYYTQVENIEVRRRTLLALRAISQERKRNYEAGDYKGKVFYFCSPMRWEKHVDSGAPEHVRLLDFTDTMEIGENFFNLDTINQQALATGMSLPKAEADAAQLAFEQKIDAYLVSAAAVKAARASPTPSPPTLTTFVPGN
jgi:hypothetical protein